jgi:hypothetical protein
MLKPSLLPIIFGCINMETRSFRNWAGVISSFFGGTEHLLNYKTVEVDGLPDEEGRYFLIVTGEENLVLSTLEIQDGKRFWHGYPDQRIIDETKIRKWKLIEFVTHPD